jgi:hypothetical protein
MNQVDNGTSPYVYHIPGQDEPANRIRLSLLAVFWVVSGAGLFTFIYQYPDRINSGMDTVNIILIIAINLNLLALFTILTHLWIWNLHGYSVSLGNYGLSVKGSHPLSGKYIRWQEIDKLKIASYPTGLKISTHESLKELKIPCELERFGQLISLMAQYIEVNQPNRNYPRLFHPRFRYVKLAMVFSIAGIASMLTYITQDVAFLLMFVIIGIYLLLDTSLFQKITLADDGLILQKFWLSRCYPFSTIKYFLFNHEHRNYSTGYYIGIVTTDIQKPTYIQLRGFEHVNVYLALHQAWQKAKTGSPKFEIEPLGSYTNIKTHGEKKNP